jgi:hypothetical protein
MNFGMCAIVVYFHVFVQIFNVSTQLGYNIGFGVVVCTS